MLVAGSLPRSFAIALVVVVVDGSVLLVGRMKCRGSFGKIPGADSGCWLLAKPQQQLDDDKDNNNNGNGHKTATKHRVQHKLVSAIIKASDPIAISE